MLPQSLCILTINQWTGNKMLHLHVAFNSKGIYAVGIPTMKGKQYEKEAEQQTAHVIVIGKLFGWWMLSQIV